MKNDYGSPSSNVPESQSMDMAEIIPYKALMRIFITIFGNNGIITWSVLSRELLLVIWFLN